MSDAVPIAFVDESFHEHEAAGFYVLAAAVIDSGALDQARQIMQALRGGRRSKLHWNQMDMLDRERAAHSVRSLNGIHLVTIGSPVPLRGQERARGISLRRLVFELHDLGVTDVFLEARQDTLDRRDVTVVQGARYDLPKGTRFRIEHRRGGEEPLLWIPDIVAGVIRIGRAGESSYQQILRDQLHLIEVDCS